MLSISRYKELLLSTPVSPDRTKTLGDVVSLNRDIESSVEEANEVIGQKLVALSPLQRILIMKIAVDERTIEDVSEEFGIDLDSVQEIYNDALSLLRGEMYGDGPRK